MRMLALLILFACAGAMSASAVVDPEPNHMGIYFDPTADVYEMTYAPFATFQAYVILTNPDFDAIRGYEFGYEMQGNAMITSTDLVGGVCDPTCEPGNHIVGLPVPLATTEATVLCTLSVVILDANPITFTLHGATPNSVDGVIWPAVLLADDTILSIGIHFWNAYTNEPMVCAAVNCLNCVVHPPVATDRVCWDEVKSMYR